MDKHKGERMPLKLECFQCGELFADITPAQMGQLTGLETCPECRIVTDRITEELQKLSAATILEVKSLTEGLAAQQQEAIAKIHEELRRCRHGLIAAALKNNAKREVNKWVSPLI
jgi:hypothetical protein